MNIKITILFIFLILLNFGNSSSDGNKEISNSDSYNDEVVFSIQSLFQRVSNLENMIIVLEEKIANLSLSSNQCNCPQTPTADDFISKFEAKIKTNGISVSKIDLSNQWIIQPEQLSERFLVFRHKTFNKNADKRLAYDGNNYRDL